MAILPLSVLNSTLSTSIPSPLPTVAQEVNQYVKYLFSFFLNCIIKKMDHEEEQQLKPPLGRAVLQRTNLSGTVEFLTPEFPMLKHSSINNLITLLYSCFSIAPHSLNQTI